MITKKTNKKSLRATLARAKRQNYEKMVIRVSLIEELLDQLDAVENLNIALAAEVNDLKPPGTYLPSKRATPAADSVLAEVRAQGAEMFAAYCGEENSVFVEAKAYYCYLPDAAYEFAAQLRQEAAQ
ncbi:hypothetical protein L8P93_20800 [Enterobacter kobei]|uniref:hypothetical protein n=1 Tax=Enterobacter kobei TaxID=208224 RepID=UPI0020041CA1|nr:hypothetical protein [Enterobacter kobei]ELE6493423.1 hypothetical protein [Enterobacter kobei]MCK7099982.1 hypothetical protein [Enterobacter kobei]